MKLYISDTNVIAKIVLFNAALGGKCLVSLLAGIFDLNTITVISDELEEWKTSGQKIKKFVVGDQNYIEKMFALSQSIELQEALNPSQLIVARQKISQKEAKLQAKGIRLSRQADDGDVEILEISQKKKYGLISSDRTVYEVGKDCGISMFIFANLIEAAYENDLVTSSEFKSAIYFIETVIKDGFLAEDKAIVDRIITKIESEE